MLRAIQTSIRIVVKRLNADRLVTASAILTIVTSAVLLAAGPIYSDAVSLSALQRTIADAEVDDSTVAISQVLPPEAHDAASDVVSTVVDSTFRSLDTSSHAHLTSESFGIEGSSRAGRNPTLTTFEWFEGFENHVDVLDGALPTPGAMTIEIALTDLAAEVMGLDVGDQLLVVDRRDESHLVEVTVTGIISLRDASAPIWAGHEILVNGQSEPGAFWTVGPLLTARQDLLDTIVTRRAEATWRIVPDFSPLTTEDLVAVENSLLDLELLLNRAFDSGPRSAAPTASPVTIDTGVDGLLGEARRSLAVTSASVLALTFQLAILAGYALALTAGLMVESRRIETDLIRSRGASPSSLATTSVVEALAFTVPAVIVAPWLASLALRVFDDFGPLSTIDLQINPRPTTTSWVLAGLAGLGALIALTLPAYLAARRFDGASPRHRRQERTSASQRAGFDLALVVIIAAIIWQLTEIGPDIAARVQGRFGVDPLLVVAPAVGLLAGSVLALRLVPLMAAVAERVVARLRTIVPALSAWQVARRPARYARSSLLLVMAIAIGFFTAAFTQTWVDSQTDQAEFRVGADLQTTPNRRTGDSISDLYLGAAHEEVEGVNLSAPVSSDRRQFERVAATGQVLAIDAERASVVNVRSDLAPDFSQLMATLEDLRPQPAVVELPGQPVTIGLTAVVTQVPLPIEPDPPTPFDSRVALLIRDGRGLVHKIDVGQLHTGGIRQQITVSLTEKTSDGRELLPAYPISILGFELDVAMPNDVPREAIIEFEQFDTRDSDGTWRHIPITGTRWSPSQRQVIGAFLRPELGVAATTGDALTLEVSTGVAEQGVVDFLFTPQGTEPTPIGAVVTRDFFEEASLSIGQVVRLSALGTLRDQVEIVGVVEAVPSILPESGPAVIIDYQSLQLVDIGPGHPVRQADRYWISSERGQDDQIASILRRDPFDSFQVIATSDVIAGLAGDPVALGTIGALTLGFFASAVFAAVGFAVSAAVSARERLLEFALLRAVGMSPTQLGRWLSLEQGALVVVAMLMGTGVGALLTAVLLPLITLTQTGDLAFPQVVIQYPWPTVLALQVIVGLVLATIIAAMIMGLRRAGLGSVLRMGEE